MTGQLVIQRGSPAHETGAETLLGEATSAGRERSLVSAVATDGAADCGGGAQMALQTVATGLRWRCSRGGPDRGGPERSVARPSAGLVLHVEGTS